jgi:hypothetical protein
VVTLTLGRNTAYPQVGNPVNVSPFLGTEVKLADAAAAAPSTPKLLVPNAVVTQKPATKKPVVATPKFKPTVRTPDFLVPGAPKEPANEMPLVQRAQQLGVWLESHKTKSRGNLQHWMYQHEWIVTGAKFGWWHGAEALKVLIKDDRRARALWGVGSLSESAARAALAQVEAKAKP